MNAAIALATEAINVSKRIAIVSEATPTNISMWNGLAPDNAGPLSDRIRTMGLLYAGFGEYYSTYTDYTDPAMWLARQNAWKWLVGAVRLFDTDYFWCNLMNGYWDGLCHGDGIVSVNSQQWPGVNTPIEFLQNGPGHSQETRDQNVQATIRSRLLNGGFVFTP